MLSQLSYSPFASSKPKKTEVGLGGLEPPTLRLSGVRSNHLSYRPSNEDGGSLVSNRQTLHKDLQRADARPFKTRQQTYSFCENVDLVTATPEGIAGVPRQSRSFDRTTVVSVERR